MRDERVTITEVARKAGVSISTVSRVLNRTAPVSEELAERVRKVVEDYQYYPSQAARILSGSETGTVGVLMNLDPEYHFQDFVSMETMRGITSYAHERGIQINIMVGALEDVCPKYLSQQLVDGIIVLGLRQEEPYLLESQHRQLPIVLTNYRKDYRSYPSVSFAHKDDAQRLTSLIISKGHTEIGFISFSRNLLYLKNREEGFFRALHEAELELPEDHVLRVHGLNEQEAGREAAMQYLAMSSKPTALMAPSDNVALSCMHALFAHNVRVPEDVSVVGVDDIPLAKYVNPPLATESLDGYQRGRIAMDMMVELMSGKQLKRRHIFLHSEIKQRPSLAEIRKDEEYHINEQTKDYSFY